MSVLSLTLLAFSLGACGGDKTSTSANPATDPTTNPTITDTATDVTPESTTEAERVYTVTDAVELAEMFGETGSTDSYLVKGTIKSITNYYYGEMYLTDGTSELLIYGVRGATDTDYFDKLEYVPQVGDTVVLKGTLNIFKDAPQMRTGYLQSYEKTHEVPSTDGYTESTIAAARSANVEAKVKLTGVVARITQTQKYSYNGFFLVDNTGSIFVYGGASAVQVKIGNTVTVIGSIAHFVSSSETSYAQKFGYQGEIQLENSYVLENDKGTTAFDKTWIQDKTIKEILDVDVTEENITTSIYHSTAILRKKDGGSFVNYYINDLDDTTGTYVYTANNGGDYAWLDDYVDKVVDIYVSPINCKSTAAGVVYRFVPIELNVIENYKYDKKLAPKFALDYSIMDQFMSLYAGDPNLELASTYSNSLLGISGVKVTYASDNENLAYFGTSANGNQVLHIKETTEIEATITATATLDGVTATDTIKVAYTDIAKNAKTIDAAIKAADGEAITIKGVVAGKTLNKVGVYVVDETGTISVTMSSEQYATLHNGDEVVFEGVKTHAKKDPTVTSYAGQAYLDGQGTYGDDANKTSGLLGVITTGATYSTKSFITNKTLTEINSIAATQDATMQIYQFSCYYTYGSGNYGQMYIYESEEASTSEEAVSMSVYCSSPSQYSFCDALKGKQVTMTAALVNWNNKTYYKLCPISITDGTTTLINPVNAD